MMKILSLFDGMSCGYIAMMLEDIQIDRYVAFEIDKYAIQTATHNFPDIEERGDVFEADFAEFEGFDWLIGGSPCTYWSIAQKNNRETEASGLGWELFSQYVRALKEAKPKWFIYENNKSMSKAIRESITEAFGFEPICINSALVSAQNRQRLYWVGRRNDDGTYSKVDVPMPEDRGILLKDILEDGCVVPKDKAYCLKHQAGNARDYFKKHHTDIKFEAVNITADGKSQCLRASCYKDGIRNLVGNDVDRRTGVAESVCVAQRGRYSDSGNRTVKGNGPIEQYYEARDDGKTNALTTVQKDNAVCEPVRVGCMPSPDGELKNSQAFRVYSTDGKSVNLTSGGGGAGGKTGLYAIPLLSEITIRSNSEIRINKNAIRGSQPNGASCAECFYEFTDKKANTLTTAHIPKIIENLENAYGYATPCEWDEDGRPIKAVSCADGKVYTVYEVKDGKITIKGKEYPIKLVDGFYIIRKLTVRECMRLQTVPEWYEFPVSDSQAYKLLGNGWTIKVIRGLIRAVENEGRME